MGFYFVYFLFHRIKVIFNCYFITAVKFAFLLVVKCVSKKKTVFFLLDMESISGDLLCERLHFR